MTGYCWTQYSRSAELQNGWMLSDQLPPVAELEPQMPSASVVSKPPHVACPHCGQYNGRRAVTPA